MAEKAEFEYTTLSESDKLLLVRDALRGRESDHYKLSQLGPLSGATPERLEAFEAEILDLREAVAEQEKKAEAEQEAAAKAAAPEAPRG